MALQLSCQSFFLAGGVRVKGEMALKGVLLDIDGTLLGSNDAHAQAFAEAARELGVKADLQHIRQLIGKGGDKLIPEAFGFDSESPQGKELGDLKGKIFKERYLPTLQPTPGARALVSRFLGEKLKLVVATSAGKDEARQLLARADVDDLIADLVSADDAESSKPDPDILQAALKKIGEKANTVVMVGDTPYDVEAAQRAGIRVIAFRCGGWSDPDLQGASAIFDDPADLLAHYPETLPSNP
jgi:phosphoglycolate phosphatase-like HAD superfamily hydrolase